MYYLYFEYDDSDLVTDIIVETAVEQFKNAYLPEYSFNTKEEANIARSKELTRLAAEYLAASHRLMERKD